MGFRVRVSVWVTFTVEIGVTWNYSYLRAN